MSKMKIIEHIKKIKNDFSYRTTLSTIFSLLINLVFIIYNGYLGIKYYDAFSIGITIYYALLFWVMLATLIVERNIVKNNKEQKDKIRIKNYKISSIFIFIIDFSLIAPIILMVVNPKDVNFGLIPAIVMATYCVYKIIKAIINYKKSKKTNNLSIVLLKEINIIGAIVSILNLQHTLIMVNGGMNDDMKTLSFVSSVGFIILIIMFSIFSFVKNKTLYKEK